MISLVGINETDGSITYALWRNDGDGVMTKINDMTNNERPEAVAGSSYTWEVDSSGSPAYAYYGNS